MRSCRGLCGRPCLVRAWAVLGLILISPMGCTRFDYHAAADRDVYGIERERQFDLRWRLPDRPVEADPRSRMRDPWDPDHEPIPPDDPSARVFQVSAYFPHEWHGWKNRSSAPIEDLTWRVMIP